MSNFTTAPDAAVVIHPRGLPGWIRWPVALVCLGYSLLALMLLLDSGASAAGSNFVPFRTIRLQLSHGFIDQLIGNTLLLAPIGFAFRIWDRSTRWILSVLVGIAIAIEVAQEIVDRVTDIDDVILNVLGGFLGSLVGSLVVAMMAIMTRRSTSAS